MQRSAMDEHGFIQSGEVAAALGISLRTLERHIIAGNIVPSHFTLGGHARFTRGHVDTALGRRPPPNNATVQVFSPPTASVPQADQEERLQKFREYCDADFAKRFGRTRPEFYDLLWEVGINEIARRHRMKTIEVRRICRRYQIPMPRAQRQAGQIARDGAKDSKRPPLRALVLPRLRAMRWTGTGEGE